MTNLLGVSLICAWVGIAVYADVQFKAAASLHSWRFAIASICYWSTSFIAFRAFKLQQWGWICLMWSVVSLAVSLALSVALYGEPFTIRRRIAAVLILGAILLSE